MEIPKGRTPPDWVYRWESQLESQLFMGTEADLLDPCNVLCNVLDADGVFHCQAMGLTFHSSFIDEDTPISRQTWSSELLGLNLHSSPANAMQT